jgi:hypothetical protein
MGYWRRFAAVLWRDAMPWARDNIFWAVVCLIVPPIAVWLHDSNHVIDWQLVRTAAWLYLTAFIAYAILQSVRAVLKLDAEQAQRIADANFRTAEAEARNTRPDIVPEVLNGIWDVEAPSKDIFSFVYLQVRLTNHSDVPTLITGCNLELNISNQRLFASSETTLFGQYKQDTEDFPSGMPPTKRLCFSPLQVAPLTKGIHQDIWVKFPVDLSSVYMVDEVFSAVACLTITDSFGMPYSSKSRSLTLRMEPLSFAPPPR